MSLIGADDCGCCGHEALATGHDRANPPGQPLLHYRPGHYRHFIAAQQQALARQPALASLTCRDSDDPALALLDGWAAVLDVLSFYQERILNEGFLRTASERRSLLELGRAIGYELRPGVAASTFLAFTLEDAAGAAAGCHIAAGLKSQSVPLQDEQPQVFETLEALDARAAWNALRVVAEEPALPHWGGNTLYLRGQQNNLKQGDALLIVGDERQQDPGNENWDLRFIRRLLLVPPAEPSADPLAGMTVVTLDRGLGSAAPYVQPARQQPRVFALRTKAALFGHAAPDWRTMPRSLRASYLGFDDDSAARISLHPQWPGFSLADLSDPPTTVASGTGLYGEYFEGIGFNRRQFSRTDATVDFRWQAGGPAGLTSETFSVRWRGWVQIPNSGDYQFAVRADDGVRLWLDGRLLIDEWQDQGATTFTATVPRLVAGQKLDLRLEFYENSGHATIELYWSGPGISNQIIPMARLYPRDVHSVHLDASYPRILAGSWLVLAIPEYQELYQILDNREDARAAFTLSGKTSRLTLRGEQLRELFNERLRDTTVYGESQQLHWAPRPLSALIGGDRLELTSWQPELNAGRWLAVSGLGLAAVATNDVARQRLLDGDALAAVQINRDQQQGLLDFADGSQLVVSLQPFSEVVALRLNSQHNGRSQLQLASPLQHQYLPTTVRINANVVAASHGDSKQMQIQPEILGSGDSSRPFQRFVLRQRPLTHTSAPTPSGTQSSLEVRVDGVLWQQAERLTALNPRQRAYLLRQQDDGSSILQFGDGHFGARLPSGEMNLSARYRVGIGQAGNLASGQISLLLNRPLGVKAVTNPVAASGGTDAESGERARHNAPLTVRALDRIVSLLDFEDFAAAFAGIGKAQAVWLWNGEQRLVHLTVVGSDGAPINLGDSLYRNLRSAMDAVRPPYQALQIAPGVVLRFSLRARLKVAPGYLAEPVYSAVSQALAAAFGFAQRHYGQSLAGSEVVAVMQQVAGVELVDLEWLQLKRANQLQLINGPDGRLAAARARWQGGQVQPAELLLLDDDGVQIMEWSA